MEKSNVTEDDIMDLTKCKMKNPDISLDELYSSIDSIHKSVSKKLFRLNIIPGLLALASLVIMTLYNLNDAAARLALIVYILSSLFICIVHKQCNKGSLFPFLVLVVLGYIALSSELKIEDVLNLIKKAV